MTTTTDREYVLGTHDAELSRLGLQHRLWADVAHAQWRRAGFAPGQTILDVGCGPGFASRDLSQLLGPEGRVLGVDESKRFIDFVNATGSPPAGSPIEGRVADAQTLGLPEASIDGAYARWVLSFTPDPEAVIAGVARALRPGACFGVHDYSHWMGLHWGPKGETIAILRRAILAAYAKAGADSDVGRKAPAMMERHGLEVIDVRPLTRIITPGQAMWQWPRTFFRTFLPSVEKLGHLTADERAAIEAEMDELERTPGAIFHTPPQVEIIARKR